MALTTPQKVASYQKIHLQQRNQSLFGTRKDIAGLKNY